MTGQRILVTGGAGFVGSHLCERLLANEHHVTCVDDLSSGSMGNVTHLVDHPRFRFVQHDVNEPLSAEVDIVFHLACPASPVWYQRDPVRTIRTCVQGTLHALELAHASDARFVLTSTSEVYGDPEVHPQPESYRGNVSPIGPRACYDEGKRCAEALAASFAQQYRLPVRIARLFNTYGPRLRQDDGRVVSNFIVQALRDQPITVYGDGSQTRSFTYVDDTVDALVRLAAADDISTPVNIGNPTETTVLELAYRIRELIGSQSDIELRALPQDDPVRRWPDISLARERLGWEPRVGLTDGLRATIADFASRLGASASLVADRRHGAL